MINCKYAKFCGGCNLINLEYTEQIIKKTNYIKDLFKKELNYNYQKQIIKSPKQYYYRNKGQYAYQKIKGTNKFLCGMYEEATHKIIEIDDCLITDEVINKVQNSIKEIILKFKLPIYDEDKNTGLIRHVLVKRSQKTNEVLVVIVTTSLEIKGINNLVKEIVKANNEVKTIILNLNNKKTSSVLGIKEKIVYGPGFIYDYLLGTKFRITSKSFYQINHDQTENLYSYIKNKANLSKNDILIDCYSGVGTIGIILASSVKKVISVEREKESTLQAISNCKINNINNVQIINEDATKYLTNFNSLVDVIIMDPPRSGSTKEFIDKINLLKVKKVIYVSCNPETLVRDLKLFSKDYQIQDIECFDMFPNTMHIETIVCLGRK